jgi:FKBP-type peptidyl-prolyl cis-trans isomerase FkpA/FKBP-type peptidyl-prolyl cis-trans isomerase FklB
MSKFSLAGVLVAALVIAACGAPSAPPEPKLETDDSKAIYALGLVIAERIDQFGLSEQELAVFESGLRDGVLKHPHKLEPKDLGQQLQAFAKTRAEASATKEKAESAAYVAKMEAEPGATKAPSGYIVKTITEGTGASPTPADTVKVHYHGTLRDGTVFDSSVDRGEPAEFVLGHVIPCWTQALTNMKVGGKYKLTCPSDTAYGDRGSPPTIRPGAALTFEVQLLDVKPTPAEPAMPDMSQMMPDAGKAPAAKPAAKPTGKKKGK